MGDFIWEINCDFIFRLWDKKVVDVKLNNKVLIINILVRKWIVWGLYVSFFFVLKKFY